MNLVRCCEAARHVHQVFAIAVCCIIAIEIKFSIFASSNLIEFHLEMLNEIQPIRTSDYYYYHYYYESPEWKLLFSTFHMLIKMVI